MDGNFNQHQQQFQHYGYVPARSNGFMIASLVMGIIAILSCSMIFTSFIFGGLSILFALLSRGYDKEFSGLAIGGIFTSILGMFCSICMFAFCMYLIFYNPEYRKFMNDTCEQMYGITFDEMLEGEMPDPDYYLNNL